MEVARVNWLRAKARVDRATEACTFAREWMGNSIRSCETYRAIWMERAENSDVRSPGHKAYAYEQAEMWNSLATRFSIKFGSNAK